MLPCEPAFKKNYMLVWHNLLEEVSMKWMDGSSVTEMERGGVYEMEIEISSIHFCDTWSGYLFHIDRNSSKKI